MVRLKYRVCSATDLYAKYFAVVLALTCRGL